MNSEKDLKNTIIKNLKDFILEFGNKVCQKRWYNYIRKRLDLFFRMEW